MNDNILIYEENSTGHIRYTKPRYKSYFELKKKIDENEKIYKIKKDNLIVEE